MITYQVIARATVNVHGVEIALSAEFAKGTVPTIVEATGNGSVARKSSESEFVNVTATYLAEAQKFTHLTGGNITPELVAGLQAELDKFYASVKQGGAK